MHRVDQFIPHLIVKNAQEALRFYKAVFGVQEGHTMMAPDGKRIMHGELLLDGHKCFISDEFSKDEGGSCMTPDSLGGTCVRITIETDDVDAILHRAVALGATVLMPAQDMFWGARYGKFLDPFGHEWGINHQVAEQRPEETENEAAKFFPRPQ
jgi:PhnB protein